MNPFTVSVFGIPMLIGILLSGCNRKAPEVVDPGGAMPEGGPSYYYPKGPRNSIARIEQLGQPKKRVVVLNFWNDTPIKTGEIGQFGADELRRGLFQSPKVILSPEIKSDLSTEDVVDASAGDKVRVAQLVREGRRLGVSAIVIGRITRVVFRQKGDEVGFFRQKHSAAAASVEVKVFDVQAGREVYATVRTGETTHTQLSALDTSNVESLEYRADLIKQSVKNATEALIGDVLRGVEKMTWQGRVARVQGTRVYINAGRSSGLILGDILRVITLGEDIYDPQSSAFLGRTQGQLKGTVEVVDFLGTDGAIAELHTGGNFQEGDGVQLY